MELSFPWRKKRMYNTVYGVGVLLCPARSGVEKGTISLSKLWYFGSASVVPLFQKMIALFLMDFFALHVLFFSLIISRFFRSQLARFSFLRSLVRSLAAGITTGDDSAMSRLNRKAAIFLVGALSCKERKSGIIECTPRMLLWNQQSTSSCVAGVSG